MAPITDGELLRLYSREHSDDAFRELVARHLDLVYSAALRQTHAQRHLAEDICQSVFAELARKGPKLICHPSIRGWLFLCTRHVAAKALRAENRRIARETTAQAMNELTSSPSAEWERVRPVLDEVLYHLKDKDREAIFMRFFDKLSFADLGNRLGVGEDAARRRVERVLERIRRLLAQRGIRSSAAALGFALTAETVAAAPKELAAGVAQAALAAASTAPTTLILTLAFMKSIALSTTFIVLVAVAGFIAGSAGLYFNHELSHDEASAPAKAAAIAAAETRLSQVKQQLAHSPPAARASPKTATSAASLENQVARDLELSRWKSEQAIAIGILYFAPFLKQRGVTGEQMQQLVAAARQAYADLGDLQEVARLAGIQIQSDPDLLAQAQQIEAQYSAAATSIIGSETLSALNAYAASINGLSQNPLQTGVAGWVSQQVAGTAFAVGDPLTTDQKAQMTQLLLKYTPDYPAGQAGDYSTLDWNGILSEAQQTSVPDFELAALQSFHAEEETWELKKQAAQAAAQAVR